MVNQAPIKEVKVAELEPDDAYYPKQAEETATASPAIESETEPTKAESDGFAKTFWGSVFFLWLAGIAFYFLPSIIAIRNPNSDAVFIVNFFLGWTFLGWVIALVMAVSKPQRIIVQSPAVKE